MYRSSSHPVNKATGIARRTAASTRKWRYSVFTLLALLGLNVTAAALETQTDPKVGERSMAKESRATAKITSVKKKKPAPLASPQLQLPAPSMPAAAANAIAAPLAAPALVPANRWFAPLAGASAGLGLSALASHFGFAEEIGSFLMFMFALAAVMLFIRFVLMSRRASSAPQFFRPDYSYAGVGEEAVVAQQYTAGPASLAAAHEVAVVRPSAMQRAREAGSIWQIPADFDVETFLRQAKSQYVRLQAAHDSANLEQLRDFTSPILFEQIRQDIESRRAGHSKTDIIALKAELLGINSDPTDHLACVRFQGFLREQTVLVGEPFDEVWNLTKPLDGTTGWLLAGVQQLDTVR